LRFCPLQCSPAAWLDRPVHHCIGLIPLRRCPTASDHGLTFVARRRRQTALAVFRPACAWQRVSHRSSRVRSRRPPPAAGHAPPLPLEGGVPLPARSGVRGPVGMLISSRPDSAHGVHWPFAALVLPAGLLDVSTHSDPRAVGRTSTSIIWSRDRPRDDFITHIPMLEEAPADHGHSLRLLGFIPGGNWPRRRSWCDRRRRTALGLVLSQVFRPPDRCLSFANHRSRRVRANSKVARAIGRW